MCTFCALIFSSTTISKKKISKIILHTNFLSLCLSITQFYLHTGYLKVSAHLTITTPHTIDELKIAITEYIQNVDGAIMNAVFENTVRRVNKCLETGGGHFEHYL